VARVVGLLEKQKRRGENRFKEFSCTQPANPRSGLSSAGVHMTGAGGLFKATDLSVARLFRQMMNKPAETTRFT
jgi:hypothetical protein